VGAEASASRNGAVALGYGAIAVKPQAVAIGRGAVAKVANTVSVGSAGNARRIVNVAEGVNPNDLINLGQLQALLSARAAEAKPTSAASLAESDALLPASTAPALAATRRPAVADSTSRLIDQVRRELTDLRALVQRQHERIAVLENFGSGAPIRTQESAP